MAEQHLAETDGQEKNAAMRFFAIRRGHVSIAFVCMVLGFMISTQFRIAAQQRATLPYQRQEELALRLLDTERERDALQARVAALEDAERKAAPTEAATAAMHEARMRAGLLPVVGTGVVVTMDDSKKTAKVGDNPNLYVIHDDDLLRVINELRAAGAEAISLNGQRLVATSEIRCAGPTLSVNNVRSAPPYEIRAIGDKETLEKALLMRGGVADTLRVWGIQLDIRIEDDVEIPAYKGAGTFRHALAAEEATP